jgi:hypothetical protein
MEVLLASIRQYRILQISHPFTIAWVYFPRHPFVSGVSPLPASAVGTLSINCIGTCQYVVVGVNLARIERPDLVIHW